MADKQFTICSVLYGDYPQLADRLLGSLSSFVDKFELRLGLNDVSQATHDMIYDNGLSMECVDVGKPPFYKYPLMRRLLFDQPITTPYVMWFDDDSYIKESAPSDWFERVADKMRTADMISKIYTMRLKGNQAHWIEDQPWFTGKSIPRTVNFAQGGWWVIETEILQKWNWPPPGDWHNGGDVMMGHLLHQQNLKLRNFEDHLGINADDTGKASSAKRRGANTRPLGADYERQSQPAVTPGNWMDTLGG
jgi:hypothetical protein